MRHMTKRALEKLAALVSAATGRTAFLAATVALIAAGLGTYAAAASYDTISHLAAAHGVALPQYNPIGIDGGLAGVIILDIVATWLAEPIWWLRLAARLFAAGTIAANAAAGWPDPTGTGLRIAAPVLFVIIIEAGRTMLLRGKRADERQRKAAARERRRRERIPRIRWVLDFGGTYALWKRMRLWKEPSYARAVNMELERLAAIEKLAMRYGAEAWQDRAPADLVWMLTSGVRMPEALTRVAELIEAEDATLQAELETVKTALRKAEAERDEAAADADALRRKLAGDRNRKRAAGGRNQKRRPAGTGTRNGKTPGTGSTAAEENLGIDAEKRILDLIAAGHTPSQAGVLAGKSDSYGRQVARKARELTETAPRDIVDSNATTEE